MSALVPLKAGRGLDGAGIGCHARWVHAAGQKIEREIEQRHVSGQASGQCGVGGAGLGPLKDPLRIP